MAGPSRIRFSPEQRAEHLLGLYQYILTRIAGDLQGEDWKRALSEALPWDDEKGSLDPFLPRVVNGPSLDGSVDSLWCHFTDLQDPMRKLGIWYLHLDEAAVLARPDPQGYGRTPWRVQGYPPMMVYVWSERSRVRHQPATVRQADLSTWCRIMQVRLLEWCPQGESTRSLLPRRFSENPGRVYQSLEHRAIAHEFTGRGYQEVIGDSRARFYQARFDERLESLIGIVKRYNGIEPRKGSSE